MGRYHFDFLRGRADWFRHGHALQRKHGPGLGQVRRGGRALSAITTHLVLLWAVVFHSVREHRLPPPEADFTVVAGIFRVAARAGVRGAARLVPGAGEPGGVGEEVS